MVIKHSNSVLWDNDAIMENAGDLAQHLRVFVVEDFSKMVSAFQEKISQLHDVGVASQNQDRADKQLVQNKGVLQEIDEAVAEQKILLEQQQEFLDVIVVLEKLYDQSIGRENPSPITKKELQTLLFFKGNNEQMSGFFKDHQHDLIDEGRFMSRNKLTPNDPTPPALTKLNDRKVGAQAIATMSADEAANILFLPEEQFMAMVGKYAGKLGGDVAMVDVDANIDAIEDLLIAKASGKNADLQVIKGGSFVDAINAKSPQGYVRH